MTEEGTPAPLPSDPAGRPDGPAQQAGPPSPAASGAAAQPAAPDPAAVGAGGAAGKGVRRDLTRAGVTVAALVLAGVPLGALWAAVAPRPDVAAVIAGTDAALTAQFGADACFMVITAVAGAVAGVLVWRFARDPGWLMPLALAVGGGAGALVAGAVGAAINSTVPGLAAVVQQSGASLSRLEDLLGFGIRAQSAYLALPLAALVAFIVPSYVVGDRRGRNRPPVPSAVTQRDHEAAAAG